jgi:ketosteroid isomerase-like protein
MKKLSGKGDPMIKRIMIVAVLVALLSAPVFLRAQGGQDEEAIKAFIQTAYVDGLMNLGDLEKTRAGFHPDFVLLGLQDGKLTRFPIADWIASAEKRKAQSQKPPLVTCKFVQVDVTGNAAAVKLELSREGKHIFTDYLSLYRFPDGWKVVGKIYHQHS